MEKTPVLKAKSFVCRSITQPSFSISNMTLISSKFASEDVLCPHSHHWKVSKLLASQAEEKPCSGIFHLLSLKKRTGRSSCWCFSPCQSIQITATLHIIVKSLYLWNENIGQGSLKTIWGIGQRPKCWSGGDWEQTEVSWRLQAGRLLRRQVDIRHHAQLQDVQTRLFVCYITSVKFIPFLQGRT